jgi:hypothetical protein
MTSRAAAAAATAEGTPIEQAQRLYDGAKFSDAVTLLRSALGSGQVTGNDVVPARALMARSLVKTGNRLEAKQQFLAVLRLDPAYRPDAVVVPPDEVDVFNLALKEVTAEQIQAGQRVPASIALFYGTGSGDNKNLGEVVKAGGGSDKFDSKPEFGGSVRFPLKPRISLDVEISRLRATDHDDGTYLSGRTLTYEASAIPLVVSLFYNLMPRPKYHVSAFIGAGSLMASQILLRVPVSASATENIGDQKQGSIFQGGLEGEYMVGSKFSVSGRVLGRSASAKDFFHGDNFTLYSSNVKLDDRKVDFGGFGATVALRAYIGY